MSKEDLQLNAYSSEEIIPGPDHMGGEPNPNVLGYQIDLANGQLDELTGSWIAYSNGQRIPEALAKNPEELLEAIQDIDSEVYYVQVGVEPEVIDLPFFEIVADPIDPFKAPNITGE